MEPGGDEAALAFEYLDSEEFNPNANDVLVVPEVLVREQLQSSALAGFPGRRGVFVQGSFLILKEFERAINYREEGFSFCLAVLPHVQEVVERHFGLGAQVVPPYIAPYFFATPDQLEAPREKRVLLYANAAYVEAGYPDFVVAKLMLERELARLGGGWELQVLEGLNHRDTAELFKTSAILVNTNVLEAFNTTVPEAMAAGCVAACYDAYGGIDFLVPGENAFCFPNNHLYPLIQQVLDLMERWDKEQEAIHRVRRKAFETASRFQRDATRGALKDALPQMIGQTA